MTTSVLAERDGVSQVILPNAIDYDSNAATVTFDTTSLGDVGYYKISVRYQLLSYSTVTETIDLLTIDAINQCENNNAVYVEELSIASPQTYTINSSDDITVTPPVPEDEASRQLGRTEFCGAFSTSLIVQNPDGTVLSNPSFASYDALNNLITIATNSVNNRGTYTIKVKHQLTQYTYVEVTKSLFNLVIDDLCLD